jgi:hypothetical protein
MGKGERVTLSLPPTMPPIRPGRLTRLANRLGLRRAELVTALWSLVLGAPIAATAVLIATVPVPQTPGVPFSPAPATIAPSRPAAEPTGEPAAEPPVAALTAPGRAPRVIAPTEPARPSRAATAPVLFANCPEARAAGRQDIPRGDPAYRTQLDGTGPGEPDGIACESGDQDAPATTEHAADPTPEPSSSKPPETSDTPTVEPSSTAAD